MKAIRDEDEFFDAIRQGAVVAIKTKLGDIDKYKISPSKKSGEFIVKSLFSGVAEKCTFECIMDGEIFGFFDAMNEGRLFLV